MAPPDDTRTTPNALRINKRDYNWARADKERLFPYLESETLITFVDRHNDSWRITLKKNKKWGPKVVSRKAAGKRPTQTRGGKGGKC